MAREKEVESTREGDSTFAVVVSVSDLQCLRQAKDPTGLAEALEARYLKRFSALCAVPLLGSRRDGVHCNRAAAHVTSARIVFIRSVVRRESSPAGGPGSIWASPAAVLVRAINLRRGWSSKAWSRSEQGRCWVGWQGWVRVLAPNFCREPFRDKLPLEAISMVRDGTARTGLVD